MKMWDRYEIVWEDSYHTGGWNPLSNVDTATEESLEQMTLGYFIGQSKRTMSFAQSAKASDRLRAEPDTYIDSVLTIPKKAIVKLTLLATLHTTGRK